MTLQQQILQHVSTLKPTDQQKVLRLTRVLLEEAKLQPTPRAVQPCRGFWKRLNGR